MFTTYFLSKCIGVFVGQVKRPNATRRAEFVGVRPFGNNRSIVSRIRHRLPGVADDNNASGVSFESQNFDVASLLYSKTSYTKLYLQLRVFRLFTRISIDLRDSMA